MSPYATDAAIRVLKSTPHVPDANEAEQAKQAFTSAFEDAETLAVYDALNARYGRGTLAYGTAAFSMPMDAFNSQLG